MPKFEIDKTGINFIKELIDGGSDKKLRSKLKDLHYADIAEIIYELSTDQATYLVKLLDSDKTADALAEVDEDIREGILENLSAKEIATPSVSIPVDFKQPWCGVQNGGISWILQRASPIAARRDPMRRRSIYGV